MFTAARTSTSSQLVNTEKALVETDSETPLSQTAGFNEQCAAGTSICGGQFWATQQYIIGMSSSWWTLGLKPELAWLS
eukprot:1591607-Amphidinium_carterae.1